MQYFSTNKNSPVVDFKEAAIRGQAPDKGLYFPEKIPQIEKEVVNEIEKFSNEEIESFLQSRNITYKRLPDDELFDMVTEKLIEPGVVGWFNGRAEFGPRALGARSIIADPRNSKAKDLLNLKIKRRESFRPFAPSILKEYTGDYFTKKDDVPFMEKVFPIKKRKAGGNTCSYTCRWNGQIANGRQRHISTLLWADRRLQKKNRCPHFIEYFI